MAVGTSNFAMSPSLAVGDALDMPSKQLKSGMRRENLSLTKWWWWCRSCAAHCHTRGISAEAEAAGRGDTRGWPLNIGKTIAAGNTHTSLLDRCYVVNVFVSTTDVFFQQRALLVGVGTTQPQARFIKGVSAKMGSPSVHSAREGQFLAADPRRRCH